MPPLAVPENPDLIYKKREPTILYLRFLGGQVYEYTRKWVYKRKTSFNAGNLELDRGIIFDIKRYAIHDGPGIRTTVFLKGCPLECWWCHNPEGIAPDPQLAYWKERCRACYECIAACPNDAISKTDSGKHVSIDRERCDQCASCIRVCPSRALEIIGREVSVDEVMEEIEKDILFYDESSGGVTFSGGEPLIQVGFLNSLLEKCKEKDIHTTADICGHAPFEDIDRIRDKVDLFLYDLKTVDDEKHKEYTGVSNQQILYNLKALSERGHRINIRIPIIPGINDSDDDLHKFAEFILSLDGRNEISLLPYHQGASAKYKRLGKPNRMLGISQPSESELEETRIKLERLGLDVRIGG